MISPTHLNPFHHKQFQFPQYANYSNLVSLLNLKNYIQTQTLYQQQFCYPNEAPSANPYSPIESDCYKDFTSAPISYSDKIENWTYPCYPVKMKTLPKEAAICLEAQIKIMIQFFIENFAIVPAEEIQEEREKYADSPVLLKLFDTLGTKYSSSRKTREELSKWVVRRVLMMGKQNIKGGQKMDQKTLSSILCKRYLLNQEKIENEGDNATEVLPYKKNSKHKTINNSFREQIFESEEFQQDYNTFLNQFDDIIEKDTTEKMRKFATFALECVEKNKINDILSYKRMPWLKSWGEKARKIAIDLEDNSIEKKYWKQIKSEDMYN